MDNVEYVPVLVGENGIGGYDLIDNRDRVFAFDYTSSGKLDHLVLYRPGMGTLWILRNNGGAFSPVFSEGSPGHGIGGYDLGDNRDQVFAFDYTSSGKLDHLVLYRPGMGTLWILRNNGGAFSPVFSEGSPGHGIGGYDLGDNRDQVFAFDYTSSGKLDHLVLYRPGMGTLWILRNNGGAFSPVFSEGSPGHGIGGYDLGDNRDQVFAFDYTSSGKLDHLVLYRPGMGTLWILRNNGGAFSPVFSEGSPGHGIGGYDLGDNRDQVFAFDYTSSGKLDHLVLYRPGLGTIWILKQNAGGFAPVYAEGSPGTGLGDYTLDNDADRVFAFDYGSAGALNHLVLYRPGRRRLWIMKRQPATPPKIDSFSPQEGVKGDIIVIYGVALRRAKGVFFNGTSARIIKVSSTWISVEVPAGFTSGPIRVDTPAGTAISTSNFSRLPIPSIRDFSPRSGKVGTGVTISGSNFGRVTTVQFNGVNAIFRTTSDTAITTTVPPNATTGPITIRNPSGGAQSSDFKVEPTILPANLAFTSTWMEPTEYPKAGTAFAVYFSFINGGGSASGEFTIRLQLDNSARSLDIKVPSLQPGTGNQVYWYFPSGLSAGDHFFYAYLDISNQVAEVNEVDNVSYHGFRVID